MIPDKIYCWKNGTGNLSFSTARVYDSMDEYIRKDLLLEWLNEMKANPMIPMNLDKVIEYIKSL